ncbi:RNA polymerase ECF-type sigma factor [Pedobacter sp. BAL39]|nr:RNA polymerase ECF-type sigma factor [Pedobacter sp. BAL39]
MAKQTIEYYIQLWLSGNEAAFGQILDFYYRRLLYACRKMVSSREDAEELVMNALLKIWQHRHRLSEVRQFDGYLFGILRQEIVGLARKRVVSFEDISDVPLAELGEVAHPELTLNELQSRYQVALNKLSPRQREVFLALREQDLSRDAIAEKMGMSVHTANSHINTALKILRQEMKEYPEALVGILVSSTLFL